MANRQDGLKGNPASKRMQNPNLKARRKRSWERGQRRKAVRIGKQRQREAWNRELRAEGVPQRMWKSEKVARGWIQK